MFLSTLSTYIRTVLSPVPWSHWMLIGLLSLILIVYVFIRKKLSVYGAIVLGISFFIGFFLLDVAVVNRIGNTLSRSSGINLATEYGRLIHGGPHRHVEMLANVAVFMPFGVVLSEFLATIKRTEGRSSIGCVTLLSFMFSLSIEFLQLILHVGVFELTDLLLNTFGGFLGACLSVLGRRVMNKRTN